MMMMTTILSFAVLWPRRKCAATFRLCMVTTLTTQLLGPIDL